MPPTGGHYSHSFLYDIPLLIDQLATPSFGLLSPVHDLSSTTQADSGTFNRSGPRASRVISQNVRYTLAQSRRRIIIR